MPSLADLLELRGSKSNGNILIGNDICTSLADYSIIMDPSVLVILYIPYNCCCIYVHPSFPVVKIHSRVYMVGRIQNDLL